jgi:penicillin-binding protein 1C
MRRLFKIGVVIVAWLAPALVGVGLVAAALAPLPERLSTPGSVAVDWQDGSVAHVFLAPDERWRVPVALDQVDPDFVKALIAVEDERFWWHPGVDPVAILRALGTNLRAGRVVSGASTLTMQVIRVLEPRPRTLSSKAIEALRALQLELCLSKEEILAAYLTFVPYGRNIEGIEAASLAYFGHRATQLSADEIATLLAVPQDPNRRYPRADHSERLTSARDAIAEFLVSRDALPQPIDLADLRAMSVPSSLQPFPRDIPHAANWLLARNPGQTRIATTLDRGTQFQTEAALARHRREHERKGIHNAAVVVVDHDSGQVRALVGSFDFWDPDKGGQIPMFDVPRSPGSALKPFLYARAIDQGTLLPEHLVEDLPASFGAYTPSNYSGDFDGLVRAEEALSRSLNLPFVMLLQQQGVDDFLGHLDLMGVESLVKTPGYYGLSAAAGGIELTPLELAGLYAALARGGSAITPTLVPTDEPPLSWQAFSPGATWLTRRALSLRDRPDFPARRRIAEIPPNVAWKTGTSFGHRDAWAAGWDSDHTVVVWSGNADMTPSHALVGSRASGPILFDVLEALSARSTELPSPPPRDLIEIQVCSLSGHLPGPGCMHHETVWALRTAVPTAQCVFHASVEVEVGSGLAVAPGCREGKQTRTDSVVTWPPEVRRYLARGQAALARVPGVHPDCRSLALGQAPTIRRPRAGRVHLLIPGMAVDDQEMPLEVDAGRPDEAIAWFLDGAYLGTAAAEDRIWWTPTPGRHDLVAVDGAGRSDRQVLVVRWMGEVEG